MLVKTIASVILVLCLGGAAIAEDTIKRFGVVGLLSGQDEFTDDKREMLIATKSGFMPETFCVAYASERESLVLIYSHNDLIFEEISSLIYRVNTRPPVTISCSEAENSMSVLVLDPDDISDLVNALVAEDAVGPVKLVVMVVDQVETKVEFDLEGIAKALQASTFVKAHIRSATGQQ
jgi:hypothetical protein